MSGSSMMWLFSALAGLTLLWKIFSSRKVKASVQNKVVLITGASSGLGEACAHVFYKAGAKVILCARRKDELERVKKDLMSLPTSGHEPKVLVVDLARISDIPSKVQETLGFHNQIDILINNGGISYRGHALETNIDVDTKVMTVNYFGQVALTKAVVPSMIKNGYGHIVTVSSVQGKIAIPFRSAYAASKHAVQAFFDCLRSEVAGQNMHVSVLSPGYIQTNLSLNAVTGQGTNYGKMDSTTASGMSAEYVAQCVLNAVLYQNKEVLLTSASHRLAVYLRNILPSVFFAIMKYRASKQK